MVGILSQNRYGEIEFVYDESWIEKEGGFAISFSLPLRKERFRQRQCRGFFEGVLPEERSRQEIAKILGVSYKTLLNKIKDYGLGRDEEAGSAVVSDEAELQHESAL